MSTDTIQCLVDSSFGTHVPQIFAKTHDMRAWNVDPTYAAALRKGPDDPSADFEYVWDRVLGSAFLIEDGVEWSLHFSDDLGLFAVSKDHIFFD